MKAIRRKLIHNVAAALQALFGATRKGDYKTLSRYILQMNQQSHLDGIVGEAACCLKEILDYRLFAFVVQEATAIDVWVDPRIYRRSIETMVERDFGVFTDFNVHFLQRETPDPTGAVAYQDRDLLSYVLLDSGCFARLYLLPERRVLPYHADIINIVVKTLAITISNFLNIRQLENAAAVDPLTGCYNRREFDRLMAHGVANASRYGKELSVIMFDIDHFKAVNDTYGHTAGDAVLREVAAAVLSVVRKGDYVVRYGGEEFAVVLPDTRIGSALDLAERLRGVVEALCVGSEGAVMKVTASFGVACLRKGGDVSSLIREVDSLLYQAKACGRNRVMPPMKLCVLDSGRQAGGGL
jgi:diguanylate cyclase (GGDEF)-like protein